MLKEIHTQALLKIHEGKLEQFKNVAGKCVQSVREKDTGTLQYDWFLNEDQTLCIVKEKYKDSDAVLQHMGNLGEALGELLSLCDLSLELFGSPSKELRNALEGINVKFYEPFLSM